MGSLKSFITNLNNNFVNILNRFKKPTFSDHYASILELNGYQPIKYTNSIILVLSRDINYWYEIEYDHHIQIRFCSNNRYVGIYYHYNYDIKIYYNSKIKKSSISLLNKENNEIEKLSISLLNETNNNWNKLVSHFKSCYYDIDKYGDYLADNHKYKYRYRHEYQYILSTISSLKNTYVAELNLHFDKNLILIIINYSLEPQNI